MEAIVAYAVLVGVAVAIAIYQRWFYAPAAAHPPFDAWIATKPLVAAFRTSPGKSVDLVHAIRPLLGEGEFSNRHGRYPWQHYFVRLECRRVTDDVVGLFAIAAVIEKSHESRPDFSTLLDALAKSPAGLVDEVWLHGQLFSRDGRPGKDRDRVGWLSDAAQDGAFAWREMIGKPAWIFGTA